jgi:ABC-type sugar transport system substrate-binding protein
MKKIIATALLAGAAAAISLPVLADTCSTGCNIQTKKAAATKGQFDYTLSCIKDSSGDELITKVTAATDAAAKALGVKKC